ncbi:MAG: phosphotransferase [Patescibacteria group bacterium]
MGITPRIMVIDDEETWKNSLSNRLRAIGYEVIAPPGVCEQLIEESLKIMSATRIDLVIVDMRLCGPTDKSDSSGKDLTLEIKRRYRDCVIIAKTIYEPNVIYSIELLRKFGEIPQVASDYLLPEEVSKKDDLENKVKKLFEMDRNNEGVGINFNLSIDPDDTISKLKEDFAGLSSKQSRYNLEEEIEVLLKSLYFEVEGGLNKIKIEPRKKGKTSALVMLVKPYYSSKYLEAEIVKIDFKERIERELRNFNQYVRGQLGGRRSPRAERTSYTDLLGAFALTDLGIDPFQLEEFEDYFKRYIFKNPYKIITAIKIHFEETCNNWFLRPIDVEMPLIVWINQEFRNWEADFLEGLNWATQGKGNDGLITLHGYDISFRNPIPVIKRAKLPSEYRETITHGDLNARNLLVDKFDRTWLIDFYRTGPSHIFRDFARLETTLLFELMETENLNALIEFSDKLSQAKSLDDDISSLENQELDNMRLIIQEIRRLASRAQGLKKGINDYFMICSCYSLKIASFKNDPPIRRRHALIHASKLLNHF